MDSGKKFTNGSFRKNNRACTCQIGPIGEWYTHQASLDQGYCYADQGLSISFVKSLVQMVTCKTPVSLYLNGF